CRTPLGWMPDKIRIGSMLNARRVRFNGKLNRSVSRQSVDEAPLDCYSGAMLSKIGFVAIVSVLLPLEFVSGQAHFKRFPETVTNDGAYVLAWGIKDDTSDNVASKTEVPPDGPELGDIDSGVIEDYLVDTA